MCMQVEKKLAVERGTDLDLYTNIIVKLQALALTSGHEIMIIFYIFSCLNSTNGRKHTPPPPPPSENISRTVSGCRGSRGTCKGSSFYVEGTVEGSFFLNLFRVFKNTLKISAPLTDK